MKSIKEFIAEEYKLFPAQQRILNMMIENSERTIITPVFARKAGKMTLKKAHDHYWYLVAPWHKKALWKMRLIDNFWCRSHYYFWPKWFTKILCKLRCTKKKMKILGFHYSQNF